MRGDRDGEPAGLGDGALRAGSREGRGRGVVRRWAREPGDAIESLKCLRRYNEQPNHEFLREAALCC